MRTDTAEDATQKKVDGRRPYTTVPLPRSGRGGDHPHT